ncbi:MAG TPA: MFS transporter [Terriglobia bacterium]|nr:MFS transporter [Terriglobia bacterium]
MPNDFKRLMAARFLSTLAVQIQAIVLGWRMYILTKDPLFLGLIGLAEAIPALGLALYAGYIVDRSRPLLVFRRVVEISLLSGFILLVSQLPSAGAGEQLQIVSLFLSSVLTGAARAFSQPAVFAIVPRIIDREALPRASAWMASSMQIARISGPALGGLFFGWMGVSASAGIVCVVLILAAGTLLFVQASPTPLQSSGKSESRRTELLSGARFVIRNPILLPALSLDMISVFFGGVTALLPIYAAEILMAGPRGLGALRAAPAIGAAVMSFWLTTFDIRERAGAWLFSAVTGFGVCILVFALSRSYVLSLLALTLSGAFDSVSMVVRMSAVQLSSPDSMRGRISAVNSIFIGSSNELGEFESGVVARLLGAVPAAVVGGVVCLATVVVVAFLSPRLRELNLEELQTAHKTAS